MKHLEKVKAKLQNKEVVLGSLVSLYDCTVSERLGFAGYDFLWIDGEHNGFDYKELLLHSSCLQQRSSELVRVPESDPALVKPILDMGVDGIIFPLGPKQLKTGKSCGSLYISSSGSSEG